MDPAASKASAFLTFGNDFGRSPDWVNRDNLFVLERFSPYHRNPGKYGLRMKGPMPLSTSTRMGVQETGEIRGFLDQLVSMRLSYEEDGVYLSLAVPEP